MIGDILQPTHLLLILVVALVVLGPKRLPEVGRTLGKGLRDFRQALSFDDNEREAFAMPPVLDAQHYTATPVQAEPAESVTAATATLPAATVTPPEAPGPSVTSSVAVSVEPATAQMHPVAPEAGLSVPQTEPPTEQTNPGS